MTLFQSFWSKPAIYNRWGKTEQLESNIWITALSCCLLKKHNIPVVMHTDDFGLQLLGHLPYTEIRTTLNKIPADTPMGQWAVSKFYAQLEHPLGDIHIDNDVLIGSRKLYEEMCDSKYDVIVQSVEDTGYGGRNFYKIPEKLLLQHKIIKHSVGVAAYNCGIIGFKNQQLKDQYIKDYFDFYDKCLKVPELKELLNTNDWTCELIIEQAHLRDLVYNKRVKCLLDHMVEAKDKKYAHLLGHAKYKQIEQIKEMLKKINPEMYNKTKEIIENYVKNIRQNNV